MAINTVVIVGRLTADPVLNATVSGTEVTSFCVAVDDKYSKDKTFFINCVAWRKNAKFICDYFHKGESIGIAGYVQTRMYEDRDGKKRTATEIVAEHISFISSKATEPRAEATEKPSATVTKPEYIVDIPSDEDLPF